jgi:hypothetical protein
MFLLLIRYAESTADCHLRPDFIVGVNSSIPESIECILQTKNNKQVSALQNVETALGLCCVLGCL